MPARVSLLVLVLLAAGASAQTPTLVAAHTVAAVDAAPSEPLVATDARAARVLAAWVDGDLAPLVAATAPARRADAWRDFAAFRRAAVGAHGEAAAFRLLGTVEAADGARTTTARLRFADGEETVALRWAADGTLVTLVRAAR